MRIEQTIRELFAHLRLRTKLLCSLGFVTIGLLCAALLTVRETAKMHVDKEIEQEAHSAILAFQVIQRQHEIALRHKADLLATLAQIRDVDASTIEDSTADPWQSEDCNLFALADASGKIVALHTKTPDITNATAEGMLHRTMKRRSSTGWWYGAGHLYQVVLQPIYADESSHALLGTVVVGHEIDAHEAQDLASIAESEVVFTYNDNVAVSTLHILQTAEFSQRENGEPLQGRTEIDGREFWASSLDLTPGASHGVSLTVLKSYDDANAYLASMNKLFLALGLLAIFGGGTLIFLISDTFTDPLARLANGVRALEKGDYAYALEAVGDDEVAEVTRAFDRMRDSLQRNEANRQQLEAQLRQAQRMEAMGRLAGGVAHDFNNLLTVIKGHSDLLLERLSSLDSLSGSSRQIAKAADRAASLTRQLLAFSRMQVLQPKVLELNSLVADMGKMLTRLIREDISFSFVPAPDLGRIKADAGQVEQVILNLVVNACDAMPNGGKLTVETRNVLVSEEMARVRPPMTSGGYVLLSVTDSGQGMDAATRAQIFEPFFTTKELGKGTGLGLATVYGVVKQSGGFIWVESEPRCGARFEIYFPRVFDAIESSQSGKSAAPTGNRQTILIAEDEDGVREIATEFLKSAGYNVLTAKDGAEALDLAKRLNVPIDVLLTDVVMPNMRGPELAKQLKALRAQIRVIYMSGYLDYDQGDGGFVEDGFFLQKPFSREAVVNKVAEALKSNSSVPAPELTSTIV
jgi:signal transduction histidine kinase/ActR/RegA family two-component response regulator